MLLITYWHKDGHPCCQKGQYIKNWSCVKEYNKSLFLSKTSIPYQPRLPSISLHHINPNSIQIVSFHTDTKSSGVDTLLNRHTTSIFRQPPEDTSSKFLRNTLQQGLPSGLFPSGPSTKLCMHLSFLPCVPYGQPISIFIRLLKYLVSTHHKAHHYPVFFTPLIVTESIWSYCYCTMFQPMTVIIREIHTEKPKEISHLLTVLSKL